MKTFKRFFIRTVALSMLFAATIHAQNSGVYATTVEPAKPAAYIFEVIFASELSPTSHIEIVFPQAFNLSSVMMATSDKLDGNLKTSVKKNTLILTRNASGTVAGGQAIDLKIATIVNPQISQEWDFVVLLKDGTTEIEKKLVRSQITLYKN